MKRGPFERKQFTAREAAHAIMTNALIDTLLYEGLRAERPAYRTRVENQIRELLEQIKARTKLEFIIPAREDVR